MTTYLGSVPDATPTSIIITIASMSARDVSSTYVIYPTSVRSSLRRYSEAQPLRLTLSGSRQTPLLGTLVREWEIEYMGVVVPDITQPATLRVSGPAYGNSARAVVLTEAEIIGRSRDTYRVRLSMMEAL